MTIQDADHQIECHEEYIWKTSEREEDQIISWAEELVNTLSVKMPPINVEELAIKVGIKEIRKASISADGILLPTKDGFTLTLNENQPATRQRFTCAHEIAHTFFRPLDCSFCYPDSEAERFKTGNSNLEHLCDIAAKHILMPDQMFRQAALRCGVSIKAIDYLADIFQTSIQATALRFVEVSREPVILMLSQVYDRPESSPKLRVRWSSQNTKSSSLSSYFIPPFLPVGEESKIHQAYKTDTICRGFENFNIANLKGAYYTEAKSFGFADNKYVISLVFLEAQTKTLI